jgi:dipeptidyl-peptidase-3
VRKIIVFSVVLLLVACGREQESVPQATDTAGAAPAATVAPGADTVEQEPVKEVQVDRFADIQVLRYEVPGFEELPLQEKKLVYYLYEAALSGRDMIYDQNYEHNLRIRRLLSAIVETYSGDRNSADYAKLLEYAKRVWFANGIHHHYSSDKMLPAFSPDTLAAMAAQSDLSRMPLDEGQTIDDLLALLNEPMFSGVVDAKKVNLDPDIDQLEGSATNFYRNVAADEAAAFYAARIDEDPERPISWGLNSQLVKEAGELRERTWKVGGMYGASIERIVHWLEEAVTVAENDKQRAWLEKLISYYRTGDLKEYDAYNIAWVADTDSRVDTVNGFTEVYGDPLGYRGSWESVLSIRDLEATRRIATIGANAQWFEDHSPILDEHKKTDVVGISAKVITVVVEGGDAAPSTPVGINLPNANWIRKEYGSKSVTLGNIMESYELAYAASGLTEEFAYSQEEKDRAKEHGGLRALLHTDMHEVIGHASGQINPGVGTPKETLKSYASTLEEARADLVALYFVMDPKLVELGLMPSLEVGKAEYDSYVRNGLQLQLRRIELGNDIEQAHMRNRQLVAAWAYERGLEGNVIEKIVEEGKTYFVVRDYEALRTLFGELLREIQRIKSEGDYAAASALVETYGVKVDRAMHQEVLDRVTPLNIAAYAGFIQPRLVPVERDGEIIDVKIEYPDDFPAQMLEYERNYSFLPHSN